MADKEYKGPIRVGRSSLIPVGGRNFYNMHAVEDLDTLERDPAANWHRGLMQGLKASGKVRDDSVMEEATRVRVVPDHRNRKISRGANVKDRKTRRKGIIIAAAVGYTKKSKTPVHRVADKNGNSWLAKQSDLELLF